MEQRNARDAVQLSCKRALAAPGATDNNDLSHIREHM
jgi:hypothetical protein